ncbi:unnamed protein product [Gongylonema pulchrum]|uniref:Cullin family profile domain-containing protein n=1 Tax=Gongylonema pulchrum TaxID=637853 RepID=A0A3P7MYI1_9BILA|nr:unnamed protein product [Gongylonema pulchrum]
MDVTTLQLSVLYCWNERGNEKLSYECLRTATQLPTAELTRTLYSLVAYPKVHQQVLCTDCSSLNPRDFNDSTLFWVNQRFAVIKNGRQQNRGRVNLIGRLQLSQETNVQAEHDEIIALRVLRVQEALVKIMKIRKRCQSAQLQTELIELLKHMFLPSKKLIKEQNGRQQNRGRVNLIGRLQLSQETNVQAEHDEIIALRVLRVQEALVKVCNCFHSLRRCECAEADTS